MKVKSEYFMNKLFNKIYNDRLTSLDVTVACARKPKLATVKVIER